MSKSLALGTIISIVMSLAVSVSASAPHLPPDAIGLNTVAVLHAEASMLKPDLLRQAADALLGSQAKIVNGALDEYRKQYVALTQSGVDSVTAIVDLSSEKKSLPWIEIFVHLAARGDAVAVEKWTRNNLPADITGKLQFDHEGDYVIIHEQRPAPARLKSPERVAQFKTALDEGGGAAICAAVLPGENVRQRLDELLELVPPQVKEALPGMLDERSWMSVRLELGESAAVRSTVQAKDQKAVAQILRECQQRADQIHQGAEQLRASGALPPDQIEKFEKTAELYKPKVDGTKLELTFAAKALRPSFEMLMPALENARAQARAIASQSNMRQLAMAIQMFTLENRGRLPDRLDQIKRYIGDDAAFARLLQNPRTGADPGYQYVKPGEKLNLVKRPSEVPMLFELRDGKQDPEGSIGYVDGHVQSRVVPATVEDPGAGSEPKR